MGDLREQLAAVKLAGAKVPSGGYVFRSNEQAADAALAVFADWLRDEVTGDLFAEATEQHHITDQTDATGHNACACGEWWDSADVEGWDQHMAYVGLAALARALTHPDTTEQQP